MSEPRPPSRWRIPVTLALAILLTPFAIWAWIVLSGDQRKVYLQSRLVRGGLVIVVIGSLPLLFVAIAAALGLWPDPNPNPIGLGLLFIFSEALGFLMALIGVVWTHVQARRA